MFRSKNSSQRGSKQKVPAEGSARGVSPANGQSIADDPLAAPGVLNVHGNWCRIGHVPQAALKAQQAHGQVLPSS